MFGDLYILKAGYSWAVLGEKMSVDTHRSPHSESGNVTTTFWKDS
jgi:hypothetical protein